MVEYVFLSSSVAFVESNILSASGPIQILTCRASPVSESPDAMGNCSNHFFQLGQLSRLLKLKFFGVCTLMFAIPLCHHVVFNNTNISNQWNNCKSYKHIQCNHTTCVPRCLHYSQPYSVSHVCSRDPTGTYATS